MFEKVKIKNIKNILLYLLSNGTATKSRLVNATELSNSTVSDTVNAMYQRGLLLSDGKDDSIGGRRSRIYRLNRDIGCFLGVCVDQDGADLCRTNACGNLIGSTRVPWQGPSPVQEQLLHLLQGVSTDTSHGRLLGVGIGVPGSVDHPAQKVLRYDPLEWVQLPLTALIRQRLDLCCLLDHTVNGQIALHKVFGGARDTDDFAVLCESFPDKLALCLDGNTCRGAHNLCGQAPGLSALCEAAAAAMPLLDLDRLLCGWSTEAGRQALEALAARLKTPHAALYQVRRSDLAQGMALLGELRWFETVYYLMKS